MSALFILISVLLLSPAGYAFKVVTIKNNRAILMSSDTTVKKGDLLLAQDSRNENRARLTVLKVGKQKVLVSFDGQMQKNYKVIKSNKSFTARKLEKEQQYTPEPETERPPTQHQRSYGLIGGFYMNTLTAQPLVGSEISLSGNSFGLSAFYDKPWNEKWALRTMATLHNINAEGVSQISACGGSKGCDLSAVMLGAEAIATYAFALHADYRVWIGGGLSLHLALTKSSNVVDTDKLTTNQSVHASFGIDYRLNKKSFIPLQCDFTYSPNSYSKSMTQMMLRSGYGLEF